MLYLGWYDPNPKKDSRTKISEAWARYELKFGKAPDVALVNERDACEVPGLEVRIVRHVPPHTFFIGTDDVSPG